jgi:predicted esterase
MLATFILLATFTYNTFAQDTLLAKNVDAILYTGQGKNQPLIVGLGGSEGGNAWASNYWKKTREEFIEKGYAFLAIGYFKTPQSPKLLDKIAIEDVYNAITLATKNSKVNKQLIALIGGSRGADLALLLGSHYRDISCVIAMSSCHVVFPGHTDHFTTSCFTWQGKELPFVPVNEEAVPFLMKRDLHSAFSAMLKDTVAEKRAAIPVEKINGAVLILSGKQDELIPATSMADKMMARFKDTGFKYQYEHIAYEGGHAEPTKHFDKVFNFLDTYFLKKGK